MNKLFLLAFICYLFAGCNREVWHAPLVVPTDSTAMMLPVPPAGKYKFNGPVTFTVQQGTGHVANPTTTGKTKSDAAAIGPGTSASCAKPAGPAWWVFALVALAGAVGWMWLRQQLPFLRQKPIFALRKP